MQAGKVFIITQDAESGRDRTPDPEVPLALHRDHSIGERVVTTGVAESHDSYGDYFEVEFSDGSARFVKAANVEEVILEAVENSDDEDSDDDEIEVEILAALSTTMKLAAFNGDAALFSIPDTDTLDSVILDAGAFEAMGQPEYINVAITPGCADCAAECAADVALQAVA